MRAHAQIGLVDMLRKEYGIVPAGMLGHSAGEIPCGYADGCLTREQTILIAYHRGGGLLFMSPLPPFVSSAKHWKLPMKGDSQHKECKKFGRTHLTGLS